MVLCTCSDPNFLVTNHCRFMDFASTEPFLPRKVLRRHATFSVMSLTENSRTLSRIDVLNCAKLEDLPFTRTKFRVLSGHFDAWLSWCRCSMSGREIYGIALVFVTDGQKK